MLYRASQHMFVTICSIPYLFMENLSLAGSEHYVSPIFENLVSNSGFFGFVISAAGDDNNCSDASASTNRN